MEVQNSINTKNARKKNAPIVAKAAPTAYATLPVRQSITAAKQNTNMKNDAAIASPSLIHFATP